MGLGSLAAMAVCFFISGLVLGVGGAYLWLRAGEIVSNDLPG